MILRRGSRQEMESAYDVSMAVQLLLDMSSVTRASNGKLGCAVAGVGGGGTDWVEELWDS